MATTHSTTDENAYVPNQLLKNSERIVGKVKPQDKDSTQLQELSLKNNTNFVAQFTMTYI